MGGVRAKVYRVAHSDDRGSGEFAQLSGAPADRSLIDLYADTGIEFIGLSDTRPDVRSTRLCSPAAREELAGQCCRAVHNLGDATESSEATLGTVRRPVNCIDLMR